MSLLVGKQVKLKHFQHKHKHQLLPWQQQSSVMMSWMQASQLTAILVTILRVRQAAELFEPVKHKANKCWCFAAAGALPLREDFDEAEAVYGALCGLSTNADTAPKVAGVMSQLVQVKVSLMRTCMHTSRSVHEHAHKVCCMHTYVQTSRTDKMCSGMHTWHPSR